jgi:hypothetical protein
MVKISKYSPSLLQGRLNFAGAGSVSLSLEHPLERMILRALFVCIALAILAYLYLVSASVLNVMARKEAAADSTRLQSSIAEMEHQYFALNKSVDIAQAQAIGLSDLPAPQYVYRPGNAAAATMVRNEI